VSDLILYTSDDGLTNLQLKAEDGSVWLTQAEIAELFQTTPQNITLHIKTIYDSRELQFEATCKENLQVRIEGRRKITRQLKLYNLDIILAVGYKIKSPRGTQFRIWATSTLREYLVKGFVMNDERLKNPATPGVMRYFDELLERIREIRASEKLFYQKVKDVYIKSVDYDSKSIQAQLFFKTVQNKMLYAVTGFTAAELIEIRSNPELPNMGLTSFKSGRVRKGDVITAKNYLTAEELGELNRIVTMFLDTAEDTAKHQQVMHMKDWEHRLDEFLQFHKRKVLTHAGNVSHDRVEKIAYNRYEIFDANRREQEKISAEIEAAEELEMLQRVEREVVKKVKNKNG